MKTLLQINSVVNSGSTGRIAEEIGQLAIKNGWESHIAYGRMARSSHSNLIRIGNSLDINFHVLQTRVFDRHGFGSKKATEKFIDKIAKIDPDIIHLHNIHGYYINVAVLFNYLKRSDKPVIWTFHDCWPFTGHCSHFEGVNCQKWQTECNHCPIKARYPASWFIDNSQNNYYRKKEIFSGVKNLTIFTPSYWLAKQVKKSFLKEYPLKVIHNGVSINVFRPESKENLHKRFQINQTEYILGAASKWTRSKGLNDFFRLRELLPEDKLIVLVGLNKNQLNSLPKGMIGIERTENVSELAALYSGAIAYVNPTYSDTFPTTNIEALACGTPVITYNTGGSPEAIDENTGIVVEKGDIKCLTEAIKTITEQGKEHYAPLCRERAEQYFNKDERFMDYLRLYESLV